MFHYQNAIIQNYKLLHALIFLILTKMFVELKVSFISDQPRVNWLREVWETSYDVKYTMNTQHAKRVLRVHGIFYEYRRTKWF
jgi:hypothetical protein